MFAIVFILFLTLFSSTSFADDTIISACENESINIGCTHGQKLNIQKAIYCYHNTNNCCGSDYTSHIVNGLCQNKPRCHFQVNRYLFGNQCYKYENNLTIYYTCKDSKPCSSTRKCNKKYQVWSTTASICPKMCPSQYKRPEKCPVDKGCECIKDYVFDRNTMCCIPKKFCPKNGVNETFSRCLAESQLYCPGPIEHPTTVSPKCVPGYVCNKNLYRNSEGCCVLYVKCPQLRG